MSDTDWREAARGIPVEEEARVYVWWMDGWVRDVVRKIDAERGFFTGYRGGVAYGLHLAIPRLDHPSERAAYDRRLALALGLDPKNGVLFEPVGISASVSVWRVTVGMKVDPEWARRQGDRPYWGAPPMVPDCVELRFPAYPPHARVTDPLLARALAWPADKRVNP